MHSAKIIFLALMCLAVVSELVGDFFFKKWALGDGMFVLGFGLLMYFVGSVFWAFTLKHETLSQAIAVFVLLSLFGAVFVGAVFFHEDLSFLNKVGIFLAAVSIVLVEM